MQEWCRVCVTHFEEPVVAACESLAEVEQGLLRLRGRGDSSFVFVGRPRFVVVVVFVDVMASNVRVLVESLPQC